MKPLLSLFILMLLTVGLPAGEVNRSSAKNPQFNAEQLSKKIRIACVGDSITFGAGIRGRDKMSYPAQLQALLGERYEVGNFGISARTLLKKGDRPYWKEKIYQQALAYLPDFVIIKLGTNDIKPSNWKHKADFDDDLKALAESFASLPSQPKVLLSYPVPVFKKRWGMTEENITEGVMPIVKQVAQQMQLDVVDFHKAVKAEQKNYANDGIHPSGEGARLMAACALEALKKSGALNNAVVAKPKLEKDAYDWYKRHNDVKAQIAVKAPDLVFIGDSITHMWGGLPKTRFPVKGGAIWQKRYAPRNAVNMGFGWDRTQNVLWRLNNGEFDNIKPKVVCLMIGTNNLSGTVNARNNTPAEIAEGIEAICEMIHTKSPKTKILLQGILPRRWEVDHPWRAQIVETNELISKLDTKDYITFVDFGDRFLNDDKTLKKELMHGTTHLSNKGYEVWAEAIEPNLKELLGE